MPRTKLLSKPISVIKQTFIPATVGGLAVGLGASTFGILGTLAGSIIAGSLFKGTAGQIIAINGIMDAMESIFAGA